MKKVLENEFVIMYLDEDKKLLNDVWNEKTADLTDDQFREIITEWLNLVISNDVELSLIDARNMQFMVDPELQSWVATEINAPAQQHSLKRAATLLPTSIFEQVSLQQTMDEMKDTNSFEAKIFAEEDEARTWLLA